MRKNYRRKKRGPVVSKKTTNDGIKFASALEKHMYKAMKEKQYAAVGSNAKVLMRLIGLDTQNINHQHGFKHGRSTSYFN